MSDETLSRVQQLETVARELGCSLAQLALAWVLRQPNISSAIIGASRPEQVTENIKAVDIRLSEDVLRRIDDILDGAVSYER